MYPLDRKWTLYFHAKNKEKSYDDNTVKIIDIDSVEYFWRTYNNIPLPQDIFSNGYKDVEVKINGVKYSPNAYSFFQHGVIPTWDDKNNVNGAELSIRKFKGLCDIAEMWKIALVDLISENFEYSNNIKGIRIVDSTLPSKPMYRIEYWFDDISYKDIIEQYILQLFNINTKLLYREHKNIKEN